MPEQLFEQITWLIFELGVVICVVIYVDGRWGR